MANGLDVTGEVLEWTKKAEEDYFGAKRLIRHRRPTEYNLVCFCAQQCAEKYLKAFLTAANKRFEFKHQIEKLILPPCIEIDASFEFIREPVRRLDAYGVDFRYPGRDADKVEAELALQAAERVREFTMGKLGLGKKRKTNERKR